MDEARISSEFAESNGNESDDGGGLRDASVEDILGVYEDGNDDDVGDGDGRRNSTKAKFRSKHFPQSVLLQSKLVRCILFSSAWSSEEVKGQLIRLLVLERKARKWYGSVVPWPYFRYGAWETIEAWAESSGDDAALSSGGGDAGTLKDLLSRMSDELECALYVLSEQSERSDGGLLGCCGVPRAFLRAGKEAARRGLPVSPHWERDGRDDSDDVEVVIVEMVKKAPMAQSPTRGRKAGAGCVNGVGPNRCGSSSTWGKSEASGKEVLKII